MELDIVPTCESYVPAVNLEQIDCASGTGFNTTSRWVYCIDAICTPPANGFSNCYCWIQEASVSVGPGAANAGASCVQRFLEQDSEPPVTGEALEAAMADGELYSTFGVYGASSFVPDMKAGLCDPFNPFRKLWLVIKTFLFYLCGSSLRHYHYSPLPTWHLSHFKINYMIRNVL